MYVFSNGYSRQYKEQYKRQVVCASSSCCLGSLDWIKASLRRCCCWDAYVMGVGHEPQHPSACSRLTSDIVAEADLLPKGSEHIALVTAVVATQDGLDGLGRLLLKSSSSMAAALLSSAVQAHQQYMPLIIRIHKTELQTVGEGKGN